jgi:hypothetical protein
MSETKLDRVIRGVAKSQAAQAKRVADKARMDKSERATKQYVVCPAMRVLDRCN